MQPGLFLDRDGVIIEHRANYVRSWEEVVIYPQALRALANVCHSPLRVVIITNQSAIGRGLISADLSAEINRRLLHEIEAAGGRVDGIFICPHRPEEGCDCRKPRPGLIFQAAQTFNIDLPTSTLIGDNLSDLQAGLAAHISTLALVQTGLGKEQIQAPRPEGLNEFQIFADLEEALSHLIPNSRP
jgi:D-glycero-D-manno-heptose 1,7-bisphosphate phosphatase